jgi:glucose/arabinose dehydrogenase
VHGVRLPRGLAFNEYGVLYFTNQGMELRGTRPVKNDPDAFCRVYAGNWHGFPDYTTHLHPVSESDFQPPEDLIIRSGYPDLSFLINHPSSGLVLANPRDVVYGAFPSQSAASGFDFAPANGPFREFAGSAIVALFGDRSPFATAGQGLNGPVGYKIVRVEVDANGRVRDFIKNVQPGPASQHGGSERKQLERPVDVKFGPDGALYILDFGQARMKNGTLEAKGGTGRIFRLLPSRAPGGQTAP